MVDSRVVVMDVHPDAEVETGIVSVNDVKVPELHKVGVLASLTVTLVACTSSINFGFSLSSNCMYYLTRCVLPTRIWMGMKQIIETP